jgi:hypothetical protein
MRKLHDFVEDLDLWFGSKHSVRKSMTYESQKRTRIAEIGKVVAQVVI